jgi:hypothetical protein
MPALQLVHLSSLSTSPVPTSGLPPSGVRKKVDQVESWRGVPASLDKVCPSSPVPTSGLPPSGVRKKVDQMDSWDQVDSVYKLATTVPAVQRSWRAGKVCKVESWTAGTRCVQAGIKGV